MLAQLLSIPGKEVNELSYKITDECVGCGTCVDSCPNEAIAEDGDVYKIQADKCLDCGVCVDSCPTGAIAEV